MKTENLQQILAWIRGTDLVEVSFKAGGEGFTLATAETPSHPNYPVPASRFTPVSSPAVGVFQFGAPGRAKAANEGSEVAEGETLGQVETGRGKVVPVLAPRAGRVSRLFVDGGAAVEYGQPILFIE